MGYTETLGVVAEIQAECARQDIKWGEQNHPDGTGGALRVSAAGAAKYLTDSAARSGSVTWRHILIEECCEAYAETDPVKLRAELVQVAAVAVQWVEAIDRRAGA